MSAQSPVGRVRRHVGSSALVEYLRRIAARAPTYATYIRERPAWALLIIFGRILLARRVETALRARRKGIRALPESRLVATPDAKAMHQTLTADGVCRGLTVDTRIAQAIRDFAETNPCFARDNQNAGFLARDIEAENAKRERDILAAYFFETIEECEAVRTLRSDKRLITIAGNYLRQNVHNIRTRLWWSFPSVRFVPGDLHAVAQDSYHFDLNDWRTLKFFFYLTDTDASAGPHQYIRGSHRKRALRHQLTVLQGKTSDELRKVYAKEDFRAITGRAGTCFAEDPFVFHTGSRPASRPRLILELEYGPYDPSPSYRYGVLG